ncbi:MAG TPA: branched-chain amino acid ABC transporter permease [Candidatus Competibacteraceae bacterium]|nr:branched-chain amino acid ABC transporter permease [Candidatus Competibacteraceae bacterium]
MSGLCRSRRWCRPELVLLTLAALLLAGCGLDTERARQCSRYLVWFEGAAALAELQHRPAPDAAEAVLLRYRSPGREGVWAEHWLECRFEPQAAGRDGLGLLGLRSDREGELPAVTVALLRVLAPRLALPEQAPGGAEWRTRFSPGTVYLLQQGVHALAAGCLYALLALGYTLIYGLLGRINLAFGDIATIGGYGALIGLALMALLNVGLLLGLILGGVVAMSVAALHSSAGERLVFRPLHGTRGHAPLVASIGLAMALQEYLRLAQGSRDQWLFALGGNRVPPLLEGGQLTLVVPPSQALVFVLTAAVAAAVLWLLYRTRFGRSYRACAQDQRAAALCGVDVGRVTARTFLLSGALAGLAGCVLVYLYGGISFYSGTLLGFKALAAAILGGIGSVPGALLGGVLVAFTETLWSAYYPATYKDVMVFVLLIVVLVLRPQGLLGGGWTRGD